jgi:hypothetical protein
MMQTMPREPSTGLVRLCHVRAAACAILVLALVACSSGQPFERPSGRRSRFSGGGQTVPTSIPPPPTGPTSGGGNTRQLGTFRTASVNGSCQRGLTCQGFEVTCPGVRAPAQGLLGTSNASSPHGVVVFFSGGLGTSWWGTTNEAAAGSILSSLNQRGLTVVLVRWLDPWLFASAGEAAGPAALGCRPATATRWIHDNIYAGLGLHPALGSCGFCITGDSGGASQVSYALTDYGLASIVNAAVIASGPPHAGIAPGCLHQQGDADLWFTSFSGPIIDGSYGFFHGGPCESHDPSWAVRWQADSLDTGGGAFRFPDTRITFLFGADDSSEGPPHGRLYVAKLQAAGSPYVSVQTVAGMGHVIGNSQTGLQAEETSLLAQV